MFQVHFPKISQITSPYFTYIQCIDGVCVPDPPSGLISFPLDSWTTTVLAQFWPRLLLLMATPTVKASRTTMKAHPTTAMTVRLDEKSKDDEEEEGKDLVRALSFVSGKLPSLPPPPTPAESLCERNETIRQETKLTFRLLQSVLRTSILRSIHT